MSMSTQFRSHSHRLRLRDDVRYLLRDDFTDTRAAGAVNGTPPTPGPGGNRAAVETDGQFTIGSGVLAYTAQATPTVKDQALYNSLAVVRAAGRVLLISQQAANMTAGYALCGWSPSAAAAWWNDGNTHTFYFAGGTPYVTHDGTAAIQYIGTLANATQYQHALVLRAAGCFWFIKGGAFTNWTLVWHRATVNTSPMYAQIVSNYSINGSCEFARIPVDLWLPTPLAYDTFPGAGALGTSLATGPDGQACTSRTWTGATWAAGAGVAANTPTLGGELAAGNLTVGTWYEITATEVNHFYAGCAVGDTFRAAAATGLDALNKVKPLTLAELFASCGNLGTPAALSDVTLAAYVTGHQGGFVARLDSAAAPANFILAYRDGANINIVECVAGVYASLGSYASAYAAGDVLRLDLSGTAWRLYKITAAGVATLLGLGVTNVTTGNLFGLFATDASVTLDNFTVFPKGASNEYAALDRYTT